VWGEGGRNETNRRDERREGLTGDGNSAESELGLDVEDTVKKEEGKR
jgi:hypothetical protein